MSYVFIKTSSEQRNRNVQQQAEDVKTHSGVLNVCLICGCKWSFSFNSMNPWKQPAAAEKMLGKDGNEVCRNSGAWTKILYQTKSIREKNNDQTP